MTCWLGLCSLNRGRPTPCIPATLYPFPTAHLAPAFPTVTTHSHPDLLLCFFFVALTPQLWQLTLAILAGHANPETQPYLVWISFWLFQATAFPGKGHIFNPGVTASLETHSVFWRHATLWKRWYHRLDLFYAFFLRALKVAGRVQGDRTGHWLRPMAVAGVNQYSIIWGYWEFRDID